MNTTLIELEALFRETENPVYAWEALLVVPLDEPLPAWIRDYLAEAAVALLVPLHDQHMTAEQALDRAPAALGLRRAGRNGNSFAEVRRAAREAGVAAKYDAARRRGLKSDAIVAAAAGQLGVDPATVHRWMQRARRRWKAQEHEVAKKRPT